MVVSLNLMRTIICLLNYSTSLVCSFCLRSSESCFQCTISSPDNNNNDNLAYEIISMGQFFYIVNTMIHGNIKFISSVDHGYPMSERSERLYIHIHTTDLKIDWIWHLLINVLRILKPEIS